MIEITIYKDWNENYAGLEMRGHASADHGKFGSNILCAGVSALCQSLLVHLERMGCLEDHEVKIGKENLLKIIPKRNYKTVVIANSFSFVRSGLDNLREQYPKEFRIQELYV